MPRVRDMGVSFKAPSIKGSPEVIDGVVTLRFSPELDSRTIRSVKSAIANFCEQRNHELQYDVLSYVAIIKATLEDVIWELLVWLGYITPEAITKASPRTKRG